MNTPSWDRILEEMHQWQLHQFPQATPHSALAHIKKELKELDDTPYDMEEWVDLFFLTIQGLTKLAREDLNAVRYEIYAKLIKNHNREWGQPDADGVVEHVRKNDYTCKAPPCMTKQCASEGRCLYKSSRDLLYELHQKEMEKAAAKYHPPVEGKTDA